MPETKCEKDNRLIDVLIDAGNEGVASFELCKILKVGCINSYLKSCRNAGYIILSRQESVRKKHTWGFDNYSKYFLKENETSVNQVSKSDSSMMQVSRTRRTRTRNVIVTKRGAR